MDTDSLIAPYQGPYPFERVPQYYDFLKAQAEAGTIASPELVLTKELTASDPKKADALEKWAKPLRGVMFLPADEATQQRFNDVAQWVQTNGRFKQHYIAPFLAGADCWLVAYALAHGGRVVTFEKPEPLSKKPKVPDVADEFNVLTINVWQMLDELDFKA
jgi:hypothetical protein